MFSLISCNQEKENLKISQNIEKNADQPTLLPLPEGTVITEIKDENNITTSLDFTFNNNSELIGYYEENGITKISTSGNGSLTCTCTGTGGCKPFTAGGKIGCLIDGCKECKGTVNSKTIAFDFIFIRNGEISAELSLSSLGSWSTIIDPQTWLDLPFMDASDLENTNFKEALNEIQDYISENAGSTENLVSIPMQIMNKKFLIDVPFSLVENGMLYSFKASGSGSTITCSGSCNYGTCKKVSAGMGQVTYCDGCQTGCTLSIK